MHLGSYKNRLTLEPRNKEKRENGFDQRAN